MNLLFDTNIILAIVRAIDGPGIISFLNPENLPIYVSVVSEGEIKSIALQKANPEFSTYPFGTSRNMGKNDLWIASLAALLGLRLVTTDSDFDHLNNVFFDIRKINQKDLLPFFKSK